MNIFLREGSTRSYKLHLISLRKFTVLHHTWLHTGSGPEVSAGDRYTVHNVSVSEMRLVILLLLLTILQRSSSSDDDNDNESDEKQLGDTRDKMFDMDFVTLSELRHTDR